MVHSIFVIQALFYVGFLLAAVTFALEQIDQMIDWLIDWLINWLIGVLVVKRLER